MGHGRWVTAGGSRPVGHGRWVTAGGSLPVGYCREPSGFISCGVRGSSGDGVTQGADRPHAWSDRAGGGSDIAPTPSAVRSVLGGLVRLLARVLTAAAAASTVVPVSVATASPSLAATGRTVTSAHVSLSAVSGSLPAGAGITVIQTCPKGAALDRNVTRAVGEFHDPRLKVASREYWVAGVVTRYRVAKALNEPGDLTLAAGIMACRIPVGRNVRTKTGTATTDLRIWGPAPSHVVLMNATVMGVIDQKHPERLLRTTVKGSGVGSSRGSLRHAVKAVQVSLNSQLGIGGVVAIGSTTRSVPRGKFASMENRYRFRIRF